MNKLILTIVMTSLVACSTTSTSLDQKILGKWSMAKVFEYGQDVTDRHNPNKDRGIEFKPDGSFISDGTPFGRNTGTWRTDNDASVLYIDSDVDDDDSEWNVTFEKDQLIWTGIGHPRKENTRLIHTRRD